MKTFITKHIRNGFFKIKFWSVIMAVCLFLGTACTNLDETLYSNLSNENFLKTDEEITAAMGAVYGGLRTIQDAGNAIHLMYCANEVCFPERSDGSWGGDGNDQQTSDHTWLPSNRFITNTWNSFYREVNTCNRVIYQLEKIDAGKYAEYISETKTIRALWYLLLMDMWGNVPLVTKFDVPQDFLPATNTRKEVYDFIEQEIKNNMNNLAKEKSLTTYARADYWTAQAILAKLYLNAEVYTGVPQWKKALDACNEIINSGLFSMTKTYRENFIAKNEGSPEAVFSIPFDQIYTGGIWNLPQRTLHYQGVQTFKMIADSWDGVSAQPDYVYLYEDGDIRKANNFLLGPQYTATGEPLMAMEGKYETDLSMDPDGPWINYTPEIGDLYHAPFQAGARISKWEIEMGNNGNLNSDFFLFRYSDILLMKAELLWRLNPADNEALNLVNLFRDRAGVPRFSALDEHNLLEERGRELFMEGWRRGDLIRFGKFNEPSILRPKGSEAFRRLYPIPKEQIDANPNLRQNPGY